MNWKKTLLICFVILLAAAAVILLIFSTEPTATQSGATQETAMLVDVMDVQRGTYQPTVQAMGTVQPSQDITLRPRISGKIIERSPDFAPGGYAQKGDTLLQINTEDYENTLQQRESELRQAITDLNIEMGRQEVAQQDYQMIQDTTALPEEKKELVLRKPQLEAAKASVQSARAAVEQARLNLKRTNITAPFDAHILSRNVNIGSQIAAGDNLGRLVGLDSYWVEATVPLSKLNRLTFTNRGQEKGSQVRVRNRTAWETGKHRKGYLYKLVGNLEEQTRMARVLISVPDPLAYQKENAERPRLMIGAFVEARISAEELTDVIRLNRDYIRENDTVWIMEDKKLRIQDVKIRFRDERYAYISEGLSEQDRVVTTNLSTVSDGARLRLESDTTATEQDTLSNTGN